MIRGRDRPSKLAEEIVQADSNFNGGFGFIVAHFRECILVWGGSEDCVHLKKMPTKVIDKFSFSTKTWSRIKAHGDIPSASYEASGVVISNDDDELAYIFGGQIMLDEYDLDDPAGMLWNELHTQLSNQLTTLSPNGKFKRVNVVGKQVLSRTASRSWSYNGNPYFAFGHSNETSHEDCAYDDKQYMPMRHEQWCLDAGVCRDEYRTNEILEFDKREKIFRRFDTEGSLLSPNDAADPSAAVAAVDEKVFVLIREQFLQLDMSTRQWTRLKDYLDHLSPYGPTFSVISDYELMLMNNKESVTRIYNIEDQSWTGGPPLPSHTDEKTGELVVGLHKHQTVEVKKGNRVTKIICLGGHRQWVPDHYRAIHQFKSKIVEIDVQQPR